MLRRTKGRIAHEDPMAVSTQILRAVRQEISFCFPHSEAAHAAQDDMGSAWRLAHHTALSS